MDAGRTDAIAVKYDPMGNRVYKSSTVNGTTTHRKYIVDIAGGLPTILCEIDTSDSSLAKSYLYADAQILAQRTHLNTDPSEYAEQFYVHDRLGSVRMMVGATVDQQTQQIDGVETVVSYTYTPFGSFYDGELPAEPMDNPWRFTGQYHDAEINQYYLRARQYDPTMMRFTGRDPVRGKLIEPLSLHRYLYCHNNSINYTDPSGKILGFVDLLLTKSIEANLRKMDYKAHKKLLDRCQGQFDSFSLVNLQRGVVYDIAVADVAGNFEKNLRKDLRDGGIEALGLFSENLGRIASFAAEGWDDRKEIKAILDEGSWGGLYDYGIDKLTDIMLDPDTYL